jgi:hypothetical protein
MIVNDFPVLPSLNWAASLEPLPQQHNHGLRIAMVHIAAQRHMLISTIS